jgi:hypothetical protein
MRPPPRACQGRFRRIRLDRDGSNRRASLGRIAVALLALDLDGNTTPIAFGSG